MENVIMDEESQRLCNLHIYNLYATNEEIGQLITSPIYWIASGLCVAALIALLLSL